MPLAILLTAVTTATVILAGGSAALKSRSATTSAPATATRAGAAGDLGGDVPPSQSKPFRFFALGDWGRRGVLNQTAVAGAMGARAAAAAAAGSPVSVIISTGDNFYPYGLVSEEDPAFDASFINVYTHPALATIPWHSTLGNHDYAPVEGPRAAAALAGGKALAPLAEECRGAGRGVCQYGPLPQLGARLPARDARWHATRGKSYVPAGAPARAVGGVEFFFFDTSPSVKSYREEAWAANPGGLNEQSPAGNLAELAAALASSPAKWRLVVAHHPPSGLRVPSRAPGLDAEVCPVAAAGGAAAFLSGHEHLLAYIATPAGPCAGVPQITSGSGGAVDSKPFTPNPGAAVAPGSVWWQGLEAGFVECAVSPSTMACDWWGTVVGAKPLYSAVIKPPAGVGMDA